jgi:dolichyl-phosphate-mannose-protein mannosyltransferase
MSMISPGHGPESGRGSARLAAYRDRLSSRAGIALILSFYLLALNFHRDQVPAGLNNDAAEEAIRGVYLLERGQIEAMDVQGVTPEGFKFGNSMETLFLYLVGAAARIFGTTSLAIQVSTWMFALAGIWLIWLLTRRLQPLSPTWVAPLLAVSSIWLFHYARSGLRANTAPVFFLAFTILLDRTESCAPRWGIGLGCGAVLGLSLYGYTSCRVLPVAFMIYVLVRLSSCGGNRMDPLRRYAAILSGALVTSVPNLLILLRQPGAFLSRGLYVVRGDMFDKSLNVLWTFLLPFHYPDYRTALGPTHMFDGVSIALTAAGLRPVHPIVGLAFAFGLVQVLRRWREPTVSFLLVAWLTGTVTLGISGPSLTRMLLLLPLYLVVAALGLGDAIHLRRAPAVIGAVLLVLTVFEARDYFVTFAQSSSSQREYRPVATEMGRHARALAADGIDVMCVVAGNANVVNYLTHDYDERVRVFEFVLPPADAHEIPLMLQNRPQIILLERASGFDLLRASFLTMGPVRSKSGWDEFDVDSQIRLMPPAGSGLNR